MRQTYKLLIHLVKNNNCEFANTKIIIQGLRVSSSALEIYKAEHEVFIIKTFGVIALVAKDLINYFQTFQTLKCCIRKFETFLMALKVFVMLHRN